MGKISNGCVTCRKRKVKCDEVKPTCERCKKATYKCGGYDQPWLNEEPYEREAHQRALVRDQIYRTRKHPLLPKDALASQGFLPAETIAQGPNLSAFREDICRSFFFHKICSGDNFSKAMCWWLSPAPRAEVQSRTLASASKAMTAAFYGRIHQQPRITNEGTKLYVEALGNLKSDLSHEVKAHTFETLGATMALNMYEMVHLSPEFHGVITHAGGIGKLVQARGPELHKTYPEKEIYLEARIILAATAIFACQRTFIDEPKWKDVPWEDDPSEKSQFDYLIDIFSDVPYFLQEIAHDNVHMTTGLPWRPNNEILQKQLLERLQMLKEIREAWHIKYSTPAWGVPVTTVSSHGSENINPPFDANIYFTDMFRAHEYCIFQINCILLFLLYQDLSPENLQPVEDMLPGLFPNGSVLNLVRNICRCTEFFCLERNGSRGYIVLTLPATIAYLAIDKNLPEAKWLYNVCKKRARGNGFGWGDFAMDQSSPFSQWMASCRDRHRNSERAGNFSERRPCWAQDSKGRRLSIGHASTQLEAALPVRASRILEEVTRYPP